VKLATPAYTQGKPFWGGSFTFDQTPGAATGWINALDADTGAIRWRYHTETVTGSAVTPTAGGIVFTGDAEGHFLVLDSGNGALLSQTQMTGPLAGGIVTYMAGGKQYVAFTTGNISRSAAEMVGVPTLVIMALADDAHPAGQQIAAAPVTGPGGALKPPNAAHGKALFQQSCISCHGADGTMIPGHSLQNIGPVLDAAQVVDRIKNPKSPMPKLFPVPYGEQDVIDLAAYVEGL
jgi:alcohol dehydrogenase (cytochrome c)